ncbi:MAG: hypothetical protein HRT61_14265 [Ekhidna sp.]|nr:hypothetical protein [Ekhidna sp.]
MKKKAISQLLFEFVSILFAVLLALGLNSYKQNSDLETEATFLREKIFLECEKNRASLDTVYRANLVFKSSLDSMLALDEIEGNFNVSISSELLTKSAWDFTKSSRSFSYIDEDFLNDASELYERQNYYMHISNQMFQNLGDMLISNPEPRRTVGISNYYLLNLNASAAELMNAYDAFIDKYQ